MGCPDGGRPAPPGIPGIPRHLACTWGDGAGAAFSVVLMGDFARESPSARARVGTTPTTTATAAARNGDAGTAMLALPNAPDLAISSPVTLTAWGRWP